MNDAERRELCESGSLDVPAACEFTGLGRSFLYELMDRGDLEYAKIGRRRVITRTSLVRLISENLVGGRGAKATASS